MQKKKEKLLEKIVQKDYNNKLEKVIEDKNFDENVKNLLLEIFYKIDVSYKDYKKVKRNVESKQDYTERIIKIIENNCDIIKMVKLNSQDVQELGDRTFLVDSENKTIICYPIERKLLYSISKIGKQEQIIKNKYFIINKTLSDMINIGNNINTVEPLRDFNGWSWLIIKKEIENITYNLIYQNLRILIGEEFLNSWITNTEYIIDYYDLFASEISDRFGEEIAKKLILNLEQLSILTSMEINPDYAKELKKFEQANEKKLLILQNKEEFIQKLTEEKRYINNKIKKIEKILSSNETLDKEFDKINKELPLDKKIFSIKVLEKQIKAEKQELLEQFEEKNELLNPKKFVEEKTKLEKIQSILEVVKLKNPIKERENLLEEFQKIFLQCFLVFINNAQNKEDIVDLMYIFRYYNLLPFNEEIDIYQNKALLNDLQRVKETLLKKAIEHKIIFTPSENIEENLKLLQFIFQSKIISLEEIYITIKKEKDKYYVELSENNENSYEEKFEINIENKQKLNVKFNKKNKLLN